MLTATTQPKTITQTIAPIVGLWADNRTDPDSPRRIEILKYKARIVFDFFRTANKLPKAVTPMDVKQYQAELEGRGLKPATVYALISQVSSFYEWARTNGHARHNPVNDARPKAPRAYQNKGTQSLGDGDVTILLDYVKGLDKLPAKRDYAMLLFYFFTGKRRSEICRLTWGDLKIEQGRILITARVKGGDYSTFEVKHPQALEALMAYANLAGVDTSPDSPVWVIVGKKAGKSRGKGITSHGFVKNLKRYAKEAGLGDIHLHQTRHTFARWVGEESGSLLEAQDALGHRNSATTKVYLQRITVKKDKFSEAIGDRLGLKK